MDSSDFSGNEDEIDEEMEEPEENGSTNEISTQSDIEIGKSVRDQLQIWDNLLCLRIRIQKVLTDANKLPSSSLFNSLKEQQPGNEEKFMLGPAVEKCFTSLSLLTDNLLDLQECMITNNSEVSKAVNSKGKSPGQGDPLNEEITSSEDEEDLELNSTKKSERYNDGEGDEKSDNEDLEEEIEDEEEELEDEEEIDDEEVNEDAGESQPSKRGRKRKKLDYKEVISNRFRSLIPFRNQSIEKWNTKTEVASGKFKNKGTSFDSFHISALKQINQILADKDRLIRRTQLKRTQYSVIGESESSGAKKIREEEIEEVDKKKPQELNYNEEIFDDDDFYHQLLREVIERKTSNSADPLELSARWLELQKIRGKAKRKVDTKSSKGRKIRYGVHSKLVNFMAPHDECPMTENAYNELLNSLFAVTS